MKLGEILNFPAATEDMQSYYSPIEKHEPVPDKPGTWNYPTHGNIQKWLNRFFNKPYHKGLIKINDNLEIDVIRGVFQLKKGHLKKMGNTYQIPFKFNDVSGDFICTQVSLGSLKNSPKRVGGSMYCWGNNIHSLEGAPEFVRHTLSLNNNNIQSLHNIHKHIKHVGRSLFIGNNPIRDSILGILKIGGLKESLSELAPFWSQEIKEAFYILERHRISRDIHACQEEMLEAGLGKFAKL